MEGQQMSLHPDVQAAIEYARRAEKGLPTDRYADGQAGEKAVARGIARLVAAVERLSEQEYLRGLEAMEVTKDPCRD